MSYVCLNSQYRTPRVNHEENYGIWVPGCVNVGSTIIKEDQLVVGKAMYEGVQGVCGKSRYLILNFAMNLKLL